jgi:hypothetical protein
MNSKDKEENELMRKKAEIFFKQGILIHITMKNKKFYNGDIMEPFGYDFMMFEDRVLGPMPIFFQQVHDMEPVEKLREVKNG